MIPYNGAIKERLQAADLLQVSNFGKEATILYWHIIRETIFCVLFKKSIEFQNTDEAILKFIQLAAHDLQFTKELQSFENIATMCEWNFEFDLSADNALQMKANFYQINSKLETYVQN